MDYRSIELKLRVKIFFAHLRNIRIGLFPI